MKKFSQSKYRKTMYLLIVITIAFSAIIATKIYVIVETQSEGFRLLKEQQSKIIISNEMPRGEIYDVNGKILADNKQNEMLMYIYPGKIFDEESKWKVAREIANILDVTNIEVTELDLQNMWINSKDAEDIYKKLTTIEYEQYTSGNLTLDQVHEIARSRITEDEINELYATDNEEVVNLKLKMDTASTSTSVIIKENLTQDEQYAIQSISKQIGGFYITTNWERTYPQKETMSSIVGRVGSIPEESWSHYSSLGYAQNEEVGVSYIELELEPLLRGTPSRQELVFDESGNIIEMKEVSTGKMGYDVKLTFDLEFQKQLDALVRDKLKNANQGQYLDRMFAAATEPETGKIKAMSGYIKADGELYEYSAGNFLSSMEVGSSVKPAVLLMGLESGKWSLGRIVFDTPWYIKGTPKKASYANFGNIDERRAIAVSSNVYFWDIVLAMADLTYVQDEGLDVTRNDFEVVRKYYQEFGLGTSTGIDFENESTGYKGNLADAGLYLDLAIGQYDTYTNLQLNQYAATMANGGSRMKMQYVDSIHEPAGFGELGRLVKETDTVLLNHLSMSQTDIDYVRSLLLGPVNDSGGTAAVLQGTDYNPTAKTGTAETFYNDNGNVVPTQNSSYIGFAPYDNPEIAVSVSIPYYVETYVAGNFNATQIARQVYDIYFNNIRNQ